MSNPDLLPLIDLLSTAVVACAGDIMLDHFVHGGVTRISPEAPIPVLNIKTQKSMLGGVGNAVRNLGAMGCGIHLFSVVGEDAPADTVTLLLQAIGRCEIHLPRESGRQTTVKTRFVANGQQLLRVDDETTAAIAASSLQALLQAFSRTVAQCSIVFLSDYAKGVLNGNHATEFIRIAQAAGKPVIVDPKGREYYRYRGATLIKPNLRELAEATAMPVDDTQAQDKAARQLLDITEARFILVTRGPAGMLLVPRDGASREFPALAREVSDVSGAGDTVAAVLAAALGSGVDPASAVGLANIAAGIVVGKAGTAVVHREEIAHEVQHRSAILASTKILPLAEAVERARHWKGRGQRVGFTGGVFDLLHPADLAVLEAARSSCDRIVVGVQSDASAGRMNPRSEPAQDQVSRAAILASLASVNAVVIYEEDTPLALVEALRPDVLVERTNNSVGGDVVKPWGGEVLLLPARVG